ncbi:MAG: TIGR03545 family protein [Planctomycetota bacterium]|nr:TIGR03545 family protein [Planctomycetota bacterium]
MIQWKFIVVRFSILAILLATLHFGSAPLLDYLLRCSVQSATGSRLEIEDLNASPFQTRVSTGPVRLGHPRKPLENLLDFERAEFKLDQAMLLRKKFIVTRGSVEGITFGSGRIESGQLEKADAVPGSQVSNLLAEKGEQVTEGLVSLLTRRFEENFETVRYSAEVLDRWPDEYRKLADEAKRLEIRIRAVRDLAASFRDNPLNTLRDLPKIEQGFRNVDRLRNELAGIRNRVSRYRAQVLVDRKNILDAKERDLARIDEIRTDKRLNGRSLSQLLVGDQQGKRVDQAIAWVQWMRKTFPHPKKTFQATRSRGETIRFRGQQDPPDLLVQLLRLSGHGTLDRKPYTFTGTVQGLTTQPEIHGQPARLQLQAEGDLQFTLKGMIDRRGTVDHDRISIEIPDLVIAARNLKMDDSVQFRLGRGRLHVNARIDLVGDRISGQVKATQKDFDLGIESEHQNEFAAEIRTMLNEDLATIREYEVVARLSGTVGDPQWQLHSNLGPQIAKAMNGSMARGYQKKKKELVARLNHETDQALAKVAGLLREQEQKVLDLVNEKSRDVFRLQERVGSLLPAGLRIR